MPNVLIASHGSRLGSPEASRLQHELTGSPSSHPSAEERLRKSDERFNAFIAASFDVVYRMSPDWKQMLQLKGPKFIEDTAGPNSTWMDQYIPIQDQPAVTDAISEAIAGKRIFELEHRVYRADGTIGWTHSRAVPMLDGQGEIVEWVGAARDVTDRRIAQEAFRDANARHERQIRLFEGVTSTTPDFVYLFDVNGRFVYANRRLLEVWGMQLSDIIGKTCRDLGYEQWHHDMHMREIAQVIQSREPIKGEVPFKAPLTGIFGVYEYIFTPVLGEDGEVEFIAGTTRDVTARKEAEVILKRDKQELESLVGQRTATLQELVGELEHFSYTLVHDMRGPLRAMRGFSEVIGELCAGSTEPELQTCLRRLMGAAERMDALITDALSYNKAIRGELPVSSVDTDALVRGMVDTYPEFVKHSANIHIEGRLPIVLGNEAGLTQCFSNLLGNAVKFVAPGQVPHVTVSSKLVPLTDGAPGKVWLFVQDRGIGITPSMLPRVFDMFTRGSADYEGTGIGLALVRKVLNRMGGCVGVESELGKGSRFWLELQLAQPSPPASHKCL